MKIRRYAEFIFAALYFDDGFAYRNSVTNDLDQWFAAEILPLEASLVRYLQRVWRNSSDVLDLRQEIFIRVYESARSVRPDAPKAFLFATARNLLTDRLRHSRVVSIDARSDAEVLDATVDELSPERRLSGRQELLKLARAFDTLSDKCRRVVWLRRVEGLSQKQTAARLGLNEDAVESQLARGMRSLANAVFSPTPEKSTLARAESVRRESQRR